MATPSGDEARVLALAGLGVLDTPHEERYDRITRLAADLFGVEGASVNLIDRDRQFAKSTAGGLVEQGAEFPREQAICSVTIEHDETLVVENLAEDERFKDYALVTEDPRLRFYAGHPLTTASGHRIGSLCVYGPTPRRFTEQDERLLQDLALWVQYEMTIAEELDRAIEVQRALLPRDALSVPGFELAGGCLPARGIGGDFYDWYTVGDGARFTVADVMGKGMGAAILAATVRAVLRGARRLDPAAAIAVASDSLIGDLEQSNSFVTLFHAHLSSDGELRYVDAGHGVAAVVRADGLVEHLTSIDRPIGVFEDDTWSERTLRLEPGDMLLVGSDGVLDLADPGRSSLEQVFEVARSGERAEDVVHRVLTMARDKKATDDTTVVVVRRNP
ncbi:PP2C family protein-serine/threonine phosphatase [Desertivibrio insolitus]|uniref:PP2C family protein-serine/threonine phosphatase n=1 Tax=Herbiconiux sp. SYSU D00978 TaxID=2812562 RepID=UPI001A96B004|nr:SpoIIE family protein phosphatase [Herbiconiux sp. SYSU D00978]